VSLDFRDENSSVVISPLDDKKTKMVVMPMRI
jgi:DNA polymerase III sliding clamp (beta) subunit (PCNA family)